LVTKREQKARLITIKRIDHATPGWRAAFLSAIALLILAACQTVDASTPVTTPSVTPRAQASATTQADGAAKSTPAGLSTGLNPTSSPSATATPRAVPYFSHVIIFIFENKEYTSVIDNPQMPYFNSLAKQYTLLTHYYATTHPSLPNYISLIAGDTLGITTDCTACFVNAPNLADLIDAAGLTWRTYQEDMPAPCYSGNTLLYAQRHDPFIYFNDIRNNTARCQHDIVPFSWLESDLANNQLPNFSFIVPNLCNSAHDCAPSAADAWMKTWVSKVMASKAFNQNTLIVLTWDEGQSNQTCCGFSSGGGRVATVLISPLARLGYQDSTPYSHYSLLKTIAESWGLEKLAHAADPQEKLILAPFAK
jgi:hypothetical protein